MLPFEKLKDYASNVDKGIDYLEVRLKNPCHLQDNNEETTKKASELIKNIESDLKSMTDSFNSFVNNENENIEKNASIVQLAEDALSEIDGTFAEMEYELAQLGISPMRRCESNENKDEINLESSFKASSSEGVRKLFLESTPSFASPNYSSTPESQGNSMNKTNS